MRKTRKLILSLFFGVILTILSYFYYNSLFSDFAGRGLPLPFYFFKDWNLYSFSSISFILDVIFWSIISFLVIILKKKFKRKI